MTSASNMHAAHLGSALQSHEVEGPVGILVYTPLERVDRAWPSDSYDQGSGSQSGQSPGDILNLFHPKHHTYTHIHTHKLIYISFLVSYTFLKSLFYIGV